MSNLVQHAKMELDAIGLTEDSTGEMNQRMQKHILTMVQAFADEGHSGFSASYALSILTKLLDFKPLTPLTGEDSEWVHVYNEERGSPVYQNKRCSSVFKGANGAYNINGRVFWDWFKDEETGEYYKANFTNPDSRVPVKFPYLASKEPEYIYAGEKEPKHIDIGEGSKESRERMNNQEDYRLILATLKKVKESPRPFHCICNSFGKHIYGMLNKDRRTICTVSRLLNLIKTATEQWPEYSGHRHYPIHTNPKVHPIIQFNKTWFYWTRLTSYGRARRRLLDFLINHFDELVKQHEKIL